jgi:hypothetical protein
MERPNAMQSFVERVVCDPSIDVNKLEQVFALQERVADREARRQFAAAMNALQREMPQVTKDAISQNRRYATYEAVDAAIRPYYTKHGFSVSFTVHAANNRIRVGCKVKHIGNHEETEHELESGPDMSGARGQATKTEVQGVGSVVTYLKRYTIMAAFAVALQDDETDDDGERSTRPSYREAAASMPRGERVADPAVYDAPAQPTAQRTDEQWITWVYKLRAACGVLRRRSEAEEVAERPSVTDALATGPEWVGKEIAAILAETYKRLPAEGDPALSDEALGEVEIAGVAEAEQALREG